MEATFKNDSLNKLADAVRQSQRSFGREFATAVNKTATGVVTLASKEIRSELPAKAKAVKEALRKGSRATDRNPRTHVSVNSTSPIPQRDLGARQTKAGVTYRDRKKGPRTLNEKAFIVQKMAGHVFKRKRGVPRLPISKQFGDSPYYVFVVYKMDVPVVKGAEERLQKEIERRIQYNIFKANQLT